MLFATKNIKKNLTFPAGSPAGDGPPGVLELPRCAEARLPSVRGPRRPSDRGLEVDVGLRGQQLGGRRLVRLQPDAGLQRSLRPQQDEEQWDHPCRPRARHQVKNNF